MLSKVATVCGTLAASALLAAPGALQAQDTDYEAIVRIMRECAKITELEARAACYDNTINAERLIAGSSALPPVPGPPEAAPPSRPARAPAQQAAAPVRPASEPARSFGKESLPPTPATRTARAGSDEVELGVTGSDRVEPGIYLLTLDDGSQWRFVDAVPWSYDAPGAGTRIELSRAALGSFQMRYESQRPVRIMRVR